MMTLVPELRVTVEALWHKTFETLIQRGVDVRAATRDATVAIDAYQETFYPEPKKVERVQPAGLDSIYVRSEALWFSRSVELAKASAACGAIVILVVTEDQYASAATHCMGCRSIKIVTILAIEEGDIRGYDAQAVYVAPGVSLSDNHWSIIQSRMRPRI